MQTSAQFLVLRDVCKQLITQENLWDPQMGNFMDINTKKYYIFESFLFIFSLLRAANPKAIKLFRDLGSNLQNAAFLKEFSSLHSK